MAITITKRRLSGSTDGLPIGITATQGGTYNTIHLGITGTSVMDEVYLYAQNNFSETLQLAIEFGHSGTNAVIRVPIPSKDGPTLIVPGFIHQASNGLSAVVAYCDSTASLATSGVGATGMVTVWGYVNRITQT